MEEVFVNLFLVSESAMSRIALLSHIWQDRLGLGGTPAVQLSPGGLGHTGPESNPLELISTAQHNPIGAIITDGGLVNSQTNRATSAHHYGLEELEEICQGCGNVQCQQCHCQFTGGKFLLNKVPERTPGKGWGWRGVLKREDSDGQENAGGEWEGDNGSSKAREMGVGA